MEIEFICSDEVIASQFPPVPASQMIPNWYKELSFYCAGKKPDAVEILQSGNGLRDLTIKACVPVRDYITGGYIIRAHSDVIITPATFEEEHGWYAASEYTKVISHPHKQCPVHMGKGKNAYMKIESPWRIKTPSGYSCMFYQPYFSLQDKYQLFPAVVDCDSYNSHAINFPGVVLAKETFTIKAGDPLMVVLPFKRNDWVHQVTVAQETKTNPVLMYLERGYKKLFHKKKVYR